MKITYSIPYLKSKVLTENVKNNRFDYNAINVFIDAAAEKMPEKAILIPVPGHKGFAEHSKNLAIKLATRTNDTYPNKTVFCYDCMEGAQRESVCNLKRQGLPFHTIDFGFKPKPNETIDFITSQQKEKRWEIIFVDNVINTGTTIRALAKAMNLEEDTYSVIAIGDTGAWKNF